MFDRIFRGHFVVIGFDEGGVYVHNTGFVDGEPNVVISREIFDLTRKSRGTDENFLIIHRNYFIIPRCLLRVFLCLLF